LAAVTVEARSSVGGALLGRSRSLFSVRTCRPAVAVGRSGRAAERYSNPLLRRDLGQLKRMKTRRWEVVTGERKGMTVRAHMSLSGGKGSQRSIFSYTNIR